MSLDKTLEQVQVDVLRALNEHAMDKYALSEFTNRPLEFVDYALGQLIKRDMVVRVLDPVGGYAIHPNFANWILAEYDDSDQAPPQGEEA